MNHICNSKYFYQFNFIYKINLFNKMLNMIIVTKLKNSYNNNE